MDRVDWVGGGGGGGWEQSSKERFIISRERLPTSALLALPSVSSPAVHVGGGGSGVGEQNSKEYSSSPVETLPACALVGSECPQYVLQQLMLGWGGTLGKQSSKEQFNRERLPPAHFWACPQQVP